MLDDLDRLMREREIEAVIVSMHEAQHPSFRWLTRGAKVTRGYAVKTAGHPPILIHYPMERDEATASGVKTVSVHEFGHSAIFQSEPNTAIAYAELFSRILRSLGVRGRVAFFGNLPVHLYFEVLQELERRTWTVARTGGEDLIQIARKRKDAQEIALIASVGERTETVVDGVREILRLARINEGVASVDGRVLTLGELKRFVSAEIHRQGMIEDHETILSQGRDAGVPHSRGDAEAQVRASVPLVIDIFPSDRQTGYFFDLTRTFCIGDVPPRLRTVHGHVRDAFNLAHQRMKAGTPAGDYQALVCDYFEARGYLTIRSSPTTSSGYVHSLGHGVGLDVHERPFFSLNPSNRDLIERGDVVTIEPGLYFPEEEIGVRIEDTLYVDERGEVQTLCRSSRELEP